MAETSIFWTTGATGDGATAYTQAQCILWLRKTFCGSANEGVNKDVDNELAVTGTSSPVAVASGEAYVYGFPYFSTASEDIAIPTPAANTRIDRIVLRANWSAQTVRITRIAGTEGAGVPSLVQTDGTTWDIPLAQCSITTGGVITVTDEREFIHPNIAVDGDMIDDDVVDSKHIVAGAIDLAHMSANSVDSPQYVDWSIDLSHMSVDSIDSPQLMDGLIDLEHMSANSVDSDQYVDGSIDLPHMSADSVDSPQYVDGSIDLVHMSADSVDDTKVGNRVPQFYRRQGGSATVWSTSGTTARTPGAVRMQAGCREWTGSAIVYASVVITFPTAFAYAPLVFATAFTNDVDINVVVYTATTTQVTLLWIDTAGGTHTSVKINWFAIGAE